MPPGLASLWLKLQHTGLKLDSRRNVLAAEKGFIGMYWSQRLGGLLKIEPTVQAVHYAYPYRHNGLSAFYRGMPQVTKAMEPAGPGRH